MAKVMILTPFYFGTGGAETFVQELEREARKKHYVFIAITNWRKVWKGINWWNGLSVISRLVWPAFRICYKYKVDTIHALGFNAGFVGVIMKKIFKVKLILTPMALYDFDNKLLRIATRWVLKQSDIVFAESELSKQNLRYGNIKVFTHWVDTKKFYPKEHKNKRLRVLFAGRPLKEKGIDIIKQVEQELKGVDFIYATNVPSKNMPRFFQMADVLVVPSLYAESPNRVVAEGAACGCVVITSNRGALPEQVKGFGKVIEPTVENFKREIELLDNGRLFLELLRQDTIAYAKEFLTEKNAEVIINEY